MGEKESIEQTRLVGILGKNLRNIGHESDLWWQKCKNEEKVQQEV